MMLAQVATQAFHAAFATRRDRRLFRALRRMLRVLAMSNVLGERVLPSPLTVKDFRMALPWLLQMLKSYFMLEAALTTFKRHCLHTRLHNFVARSMWVSEQVLEGVSSMGGMVEQQQQGVKGAMAAVSQRGAKGRRVPKRTVTWRPVRVGTSFESVLHITLAV